MDCYFLLLAVIIHSQKFTLKLLRHIQVLLSIDRYLNTYKVLTVDQNDL